MANEFTVGILDDSDSGLGIMEELVDAVLRNLGHDKSAVALRPSSDRREADIIAASGDCDLRMLGALTETMTPAIGSALSGGPVKHFFLITGGVFPGALTALKDSLNGHRLETLGLFWYYSGDDMTDDPRVVDDLVGLCQAYGGALVSTSANLSGQPAVSDYDALDPALLTRVDAIVPGQTGGLARPTAIRDALTGQALRE